MKNINLKLKYLLIYEKEEKYGDKGPTVNMLLKKIKMIKK